jgi:fluoride ion exporter CrcB/FEX
MDDSSTVDRVVTSRGAHAREFVWTVAGATAGSFVRFWVDRAWPGHALESMLVVTSVAAAFVGFALIASIRATMKAVLAAAGGAAGSISAVATQAALALPVHSLVDLAGFFVCAVASVPLGMLVAVAVLGNPQPQERL